ncbi:MAG: murein biosynthesis integral membrane protein MurJ [Proteobacteria bacterium]|nr:murein biosynthesis integral membrane protein MurJ [Pseudomonadota bacterium]
MPTSLHSKTSSLAQPSLPVARVKTRLDYLAGLIMSITLVSRLLGFLRDIIFAQFFGATAAFDAFVIAFKIPNFMRRLFGEGAFSQAFIPILVEYRAHRNKPELQSLVNGVFSAVGAALLVVVLVGELLAPLWVYLLAPGFIHHTENYQLAVHLIRITFPYLLAISLVALAGAVLNAYNRFVLTAFTPVLLNIMLISAALITRFHQSPLFSIQILAWAVTFSGLIQLVLQWPALRSLSLTPAVSWRWRDSGVKRVIKQMAPAILGVSIGQISLLIDNFFASFLPPGSISWLYYSDRLLYFPLGMIGVSLSVVVMPHLALTHQQGLKQNFGKIMDWAVRIVLVLAIPATLGLIFLAGPIITTLLHHGAFSIDDVKMSQKSLMAFTLGLPALMLIKVLAAACYAHQEMRKPALFTLLAIILNILGNFLLIKPLAHAGLALSSAIASWINAVILLCFLSKKKYLVWEVGWLKLFLAILVGSLLMAAVLLLSHKPLSEWLHWNLFQKIWRLLSLILSGTALYAIGLWACGIRWRHFRFQEQ